MVKCDLKKLFIFIIIINLIFLIYFFTSNDSNLDKIKTGDHTNNNHFKFNDFLSDPKPSIEEDPVLQTQ